MKNRIRFSFYLIGMISMLAMASCKKDTPSANFGNGKLSISVTGIQASNEAKTNKKKKLSASSRQGQSSPDVSAQTNVHRESGFTVEALAEQTPMDDNIYLHKKQVSHAVKNVAMRGNVAGAKYAPEGMTYRILMYNKHTGKLWCSLPARVGTPLAIDVVKGDTYEWFAYSYHNEEEITEPEDLYNPSLQTSIDKDLLYAKGEISIPKTAKDQQDNHELAISFTHRLAQLHVKVNASVMAAYSKIHSLNVSFDRDDYIKRGTFHIRDNQIDNIEVVPTSTIFNSVDPSDPIWEQNYYTVDPAAAASFKLILHDFNLTFKYADPSVATRNLATYHGAANKPINTYNFSSPAVGQRLSATFNLWYTFAPKRILHVSNGSSLGYAMETGPTWDMMNSAQNFGSDTASIVKMAPWAPGKGPWIGGESANNWANWLASNSYETTIADRINPADPSKTPDIVIFGYSTTWIGPVLRQALLDYLDRDGIVILQFQGTYYQENADFFNELFGVNNIELYRYGGGGAMFPIEGTDPDDEILNGHFGDCRGQHWGEDNGTTLGIVNAPADQIVAYAYGKPINSAATNVPHRVTMFKHKTKNLFFVGDGGFVAYYNGSGYYYRYPFRYDETTKRPLPKPYGHAGNGYVQDSKEAYNSILFGNLMLWAARTAQFHGQHPWEYAGPPTP